jgi:Rap1a immunity proteins
MRAIVGTLCAALLFCNTAARAQSANELLQACEGLERTMTFVGDNISFPPSQTNDECWYFMSAVQQYSTLAVPGTGQRFLGACTGPTTTLSQLIRAFTNYARSHPQHLNATATVVTYNAMQSTFPCN